MLSGQYTIIRVFVSLIVVTLLAWRHHHIINYDNIPIQDDDVSNSIMGIVDDDNNNNNNNNIVGGDTATTTTKRLSNEIKSNDDESKQKNDELSSNAIKNDDHSSNNHPSPPLRPHHRRRHLTSQHSTSSSSDTIPIHSSTVTISPTTSIPYLHCGFTYGSGPTSGDRATVHDNQREILLLHGAKYTKDDWLSGDIMQRLCKEGSGGDYNDPLSVTALDLPVSASGMDLLQTVRRLSIEGVISGRPLVIVTPSASGKSVLTAAAMGLQRTDGSLVHRSILKSLLRGWVPVAANAAKTASEETLRRFVDEGIPVLAINGSRDKGGKVTNERLEREAGARVVEMEGGHPCYLDSPEEFVRVVIDFVDELVPSKEFVGEELLLSAKGDDGRVVNGVVFTISSQYDSKDGGQAIDYTHCGPNYSSSSDDATTGPTPPEVLLLHAGHFTRHEWYTSGIIQKLCSSSDATPPLSVTAIDLPTHSDGIELLQVFRGLEHSHVISGRPLIVVTPSASGKTVVSAADYDAVKMADEEEEELILRQMVRGWIPVGCGVVMLAREEALRLFARDGIPVLAMRGTRDEKRGEVNERLEMYAEATAVEIEGAHDCYLDSPDLFVDHLKRFAQGLIKEEN